MKLDRGVMRHRQDLSWSQLQRKNDTRHVTLVMTSAQKMARH